MRRALRRLWPSFEASFVSTAPYEAALDRLARGQSQTWAGRHVDKLLDIGLRIEVDRRRGSFHGHRSTLGPLSLGIDFHGSVTGIDVGTRVTLTAVPDRWAAVFFRAAIALELSLLLAVSIALGSWVVAGASIAMAAVLLASAHLLTFLAGVSCQAALKAIVDGGDARRYLA